MAIEELQGGRYRYERLLGSGGMGEVYLMQDTRVGRLVAIKVVRASNPARGERATDATRLFQREARAIATLEHPHILPLYDFGEEMRAEMAITYMVMPYCADGSLEAWQQAQGQPFLSPQQVACLVEQAGEALQYAHDHKIIHLDVKPSNFLLRRNSRDPQRPTLLLADFGIARNFTTVSRSSRTIRGTPTSMAPEQWSGDPVFASDQYALAVMAYELLAGRPPFTGSMEQLMYQHFTVQAPPPGKFSPRLPSALDTVLLRALAKKPEERFPTVADFAQALARAVPPPACGDLSDYETRVIAVEQVPPAQLLARDALLPGSAGDPLLAPVEETATPAADVLAQACALEEIEPTASPVSMVQTRETPPLFAASAEPDLPTAADSAAQQRLSAVPLATARLPLARRVLLAVLAVAVIVLLLAGATSLLRRQSSSASRVLTPPTDGQAVATATPALSPTPVPGLYIAGTYNGTMTDSTTQQVTRLSVSLVQTQGQGVIRGQVTLRASSQQVYRLDGAVDLQGNFSFSARQSPAQTPFYFYGATQPGEYLHGYYCRSDSSACRANTGYFTVGPRY
jgi:serine/threonine protein kinase